MWSLLSFFRICIREYLYLGTYVGMPTLRALEFDCDKFDESSNLYRNGSLSFFSGLRLTFLKLLSSAGLTNLISRFDDID